MKGLKLICEVCGHRAESVFCGLAGSHLTKLNREKSVHEYQRNQVIFYEGNQPFAIYCIYSGKVKLYKVGRKSEPLVIRLLGPGEIMGYRALFANEPYAATAEAVETTVICTISKQTLLDLLHQSPDLALRLLSKMAQQLRISEDEMLVLAQESVRQRTARLILFCCGDEKGEPGVSFKCPLSHTEMAQMIGTTPETFSRTLNYLAKRKFIRLSSTVIYIENPSALRVLAYGSSV